MATSTSSLNSILSPFSFTIPKQSSIIPTWKWNPFHLHKVSAPKMASNGGFLRFGSIISNSLRNNSSSFGYNTNTKNGMIMVDSCLVFPPPKFKKPRAIIKFLGGAFIGAVAHVSYSYVVELLAKEGFLLVLVPYNVTFDHEDAAKQVYEKFNACLDTLLSSGLPDAKLTPSQLVDLPVFSVGHREKRSDKLVIKS